MSMTIYFHWTGHSVHKRDIEGATANSELAWHIQDHLKKRYPNARFVRRFIGDDVPADVKPGDLLIGHLGPWADTDITDNVFPFMPWPGTSEGTWYAKWFVKAPRNMAALRSCKKIFALSGMHQYELSKTDPFFKTLMDRLVHIDVAVDRKLFPQCKHTFNGVDDRGYYYMGNLYPVKNVGTSVEFCRINNKRMLFMNGYKDWVNKAPRLKVLGFVKNQDHKLWDMIADEVDCIAHMAIVDCQPLSVVESASRGFVPCVAPATGFECKGAFQAASSDEKDVHLNMQMAQRATDKEMLDRQKECIAFVEKERSWAKFKNTIDQVLGASGI